MGTVEDEALAAMQAAEAEGGDVMEAYRAEYERRLAERHERLAREAQASWRAMDGWDRVTTREEWEAAVRRAYDDYDSGAFLIERLGAARYLDPPLMAVLLGLRDRLVEEHGATTAAELMLIDSAVLAFYHQNRIAGWIGDLSRWLESEFFRQGGLSVRVGERERTSWEVKIRGLQIEEIVERLAERLMPLLDRSNRMLLRNLKALQARAEGLPPTVSIGSAGQVNVAGQQLNANGAPPGSPDRHDER